MKTAITLETQRLILRPWREEDAENLYHLASDPCVAAPAGWSPHTCVSHSLEIIRTILCKPTVWAVCEKNSDPIGNIHLDFETPLRKENGECELGYWLGKPFWGQGLMTEAANALLRYAFDGFGISAVWSGYYDGNERSRRVQEKLGFVYHHPDMISCTDRFEQIQLVHRTYLSRESWQQRYPEGLDEKRSVDRPLGNESAQILGGSLCRPKK